MSKTKGIHRTLKVPEPVDDIIVGIQATNKWTWSKSAIFAICLGLRMTEKEIETKYGDFFRSHCKEEK